MEQINIQRAIDTLNLEAKAVKDQINHLDDQFIKAVSLIEKSSGRVVIIGLGKSGHIGRKIAATMASIGVPAIYLHPAECLHGDLGMIMKDDVVIMLSYSGETEEIKQVLPVLQKMNLKIIAITGKTDSPTWKNCDVIIDSSVEKEACPYNLAPTSSTTANTSLSVRNWMQPFRKQALSLLPHLRLMLYPPPITKV